MPCGLGPATAFSCSAGRGEEQSLGLMVSRKDLFRVLSEGCVHGDGEPREVCLLAYLWRSEDSFQELVLVCHKVCEDSTGLVRFGGRCFTC